MTRHIRFDMKFIKASQQTTDSWEENILKISSRSFHFDGLDRREKMTQVARSFRHLYRVIVVRSLLSGLAKIAIIPRTSVLRIRNSERHVASVNCGNRCLSKHAMKLEDEKNAILFCSSNKVLTLEAHVRENDSWRKGNLIPLTYVE